VEEEIVIDKSKIEDMDLDELKEIGLELIRDGMVAVIVLSGGQGSRLGMDRNKGEFDMHLPSMKTLFQILIEKFLKIQMIAH
jgi:UDP-N-acetylglucosamine/UDP-N-acetylgalactosamine diphosphorylase